MCNLDLIDLGIGFLFLCLWVRRASAVFVTLRCGLEIGAAASGMCSYLMSFRYLDGTQYCHIFAKSVSLSMSPRLCEGQAPSTEHPLGWRVT